jgi:uncharacterized alkaline shock family protein YloU
MSDEIRLDGLGLAPGVLDTIVTLAAKQVEGVVAVGAPGIAGLVAKGKGAAAKPIEIEMAEDATLNLGVHLTLAYGMPLHDVARSVQESVADAISSQVGVKVGAVDVFVDSIVFDA